MSYIYISLSLSLSLSIALSGSSASSILLTYRTSSRFFCPQLPPCLLITFQTFSGISSWEVLLSFVVDESSRIPGSFRRFSVLAPNPSLSIVISGGVSKIGGNKRRIGKHRSTQNQSGVAISLLCTRTYTSVDLRMSADQEAAKEARIAGLNSELHQVEYLSTGPSLVPQCRWCRCLCDNLDREARPGTPSTRNASDIFRPSKASW